MIMIALKGANRFCSVPTAPRTASSMYAQAAGCKLAQITCNTSSTDHVKHVVCQMLRRDSSAIKFDRVEIALMLTVFYWVKRGEIPVSVAFQDVTKPPGHRGGSREASPQPHTTTTWFSPVVFLLTTVNSFGECPTYHNGMILPSGSLTDHCEQF